MPKNDKKRNPIMFLSGPISVNSHCIYVCFIPSDRSHTRISHVITDTSYYSTTDISVKESLPMHLNMCQEPLTTLKHQLIRCILQLSFKTIFSSTEILISAVSLCTYLLWMRNLSLRNKTLLQQYHSQIH